MIQIGKAYDEHGNQSLVEQVTFFYNYNRKICKEIENIKALLSKVLCLHECKDGRRYANFVNLLVRLLERSMGFVIGIARYYYLDISLCV